MEEKDNFNDVVAIVRRQRENQSPVYAGVLESIVGEQRRMNTPAMSESDKQRETYAAIEKWNAEEVINQLNQ